jgi:hypothetical protein
MPTLVAIPQHNKKRYAIGPLLDWIRDAKLPDAEVLMRFHRGVYGEINAVKKQREYFRMMAVLTDCSHLLFIGADTIPPLDVLPKLLAHNKDVVGGVYYNRFQPNRAIVWKNGNPEWNERGLLPTELQEVDGMGMDCVLLSRKAFESVSFSDWDVNDDDYPYYDRLKEQGFKIYLDPQVVCKHYIDESIYV